MCSLSAQPVEESAHIVNKEVWGLHGGEVSAGAARVDLNRPLLA
jgi:hypothetical protein